MIVSLKRNKKGVVVEVEPKSPTFSCKVQDVLNEETHLTARVNGKTLDIEFEDEEFTTNIDEAQVSELEMFIKNYNW